MSTKLKGKAVVGQSGGPTCVINQSLVGVIEEAARQDIITELLGTVHGVEGIVKSNFVQLDKIAKDELEKVAITPAAALGSSRVKPDKKLCEQIFDVFRKNDVRYFFYIGGNDSASSAHIINEMAQQANYEFHVFHVPKTIDNDLMVTDHCPGFGSAATFVCHAVMGNDFDNRSLPGVKLDIIMGRHAGFLTAAAVMAKHREDSGPHLIYVPERNVSMEKLCGDVEKTYQKHGRCMVVVSEGIVDENHVPWGQRIQENVEADAHGNVQLSGSGALGDFLVAKLKKSLPAKTRVRADTYGYLQRSFPGVYSQSDRQEARLCGQMAVRYACQQSISGSVSMKRLGNGKDYKIETFVTELESVAAKTKVLSDEMINAEGNFINERFKEYLAPLMGELPRVGYLR